MSYNIEENKQNGIANAAAKKDTEAVGVPEWLARQLEIVFPTLPLSTELAKEPSDAGKNIWGNIRTQVDYEPEKEEYCGPDYVAPTMEEEAYDDEAASDHYETQQAEIEAREKDITENEEDEETEGCDDYGDNQDHDDCDLSEFEEMFDEPDYECF